MIKVDKAEVTLDGAMPELLAELAGAIESVYKAVAKKTDEDFAKEMVEKAMKLAFSTEEDLDTEVTKSLKSLLAILKKGEE